MLAVISGCGSASREPGAHMMGGGSEYHYSSLRCAAPSTPPGRTVDVSLGDMGMTRMMGGLVPAGEHMMLTAVPAEAPAGQVTLVVSNRGWRTHELVILPLGAEAQPGPISAGSDGKVPEAASLGEVSKSCAAGSGEAITAGAVGRTTVSLTAGRYELMCNLRNHYANGIHHELVVV